MKGFLPVVLLLGSSLSGTVMAAAADYPSCQPLAAQQGQSTEHAGKDRLYQAFSRRANVLQADIGNARKAGRLTHKQADGLWQKVQHMRHEADGFVKSQGFLSAGEAASYQRGLDGLAQQLCASLPRVNPPA